MVSQVAAVKVGGLQAFSPVGTQSLFNKVVVNTPRLMVSLTGRVRCEAGKGPLADAKEIVVMRSCFHIVLDI